MAYWLVGAMFGGSETSLELFIRHGYWEKRSIESEMNALNDVGR